MHHLAGHYLGKAATLSSPLVSHVLFAGNGSSPNNPMPPNSSLETPPSLNLQPPSSSNTNGSTIFGGELPQDETKHNRRCMWKEIERVVYTSFPSALASFGADANFRKSR